MRRPTTNAPRRLVVVGLVVALVAVACGGSDSAEPTVQPAAEATTQPEATAEPAESIVAITADMSLEEQLAAARANWAANGPADYDLISEFLCEDPCMGATVRAIINQNDLMAWTRESDGFARAQTMLDAFRAVEILVRNEMPSEKLVEFDPTNGAVTRIVLPFDPVRTDDDRETRYTLETATIIEPSDHGPAVAEANCPDVDWATVAGSQFEVSLPADMVSVDIEGVDSEVAEHVSESFDVFWDFGEFSNQLDNWQGPFTDEVVNYSGIGGRIVVAEPVPGFFDGKNVTAAHFGRVDTTYANEGMWGGLTIFVTYADAADALTADCIVRSITFNPS